MSQKGKVESGAELLARLGPRPSLHGLEASEVLGFEPCPGDLLELYGGEGVGKTELLLHLVCSAILPNSPAHRCHGNKTEVIWVDSDLKFSVLRLAVLLEQRLMSRLNSRSQTQRGEYGDSVSKASGQSARPLVTDVSAQYQSSESELVSKRIGQSGEQSAEDCEVVKVSTPTGERVELGREGIWGPGGDNIVFSGKTAWTGEKTCQTEGGNQRKVNATSSERQGHSLRKSDCVGDPATHKSRTSLHEPDTDSRTNREKSWSTNSTLKRKAQDMESDSSDSHRDGSRIIKSQDVCGGLTSKDTSLTYSVHAGGEGQLCNVEETDKQKQSVEEVERRVGECLQRVHVLRCTSSQNLICTLHSIQSLIAANRNIAVLVIDPISAFFWSDKCSDIHQTSSFLHKNMSHVVSVLNNITKSYGVLVMVAKQALVKSQRKGQAGSIVSTARGLTGHAGENTHVEFLGKAWNGAVTWRLVCSKTVSWQRGVRMRHYTLTSSAAQKQFTIDESGVHVLDH